LTLLFFWGSELTLIITDRNGNDAEEKKRSSSTDPNFN